MNVLKLLFIPFKRLGHQSSVLVPVGSGYPESITPQETARLTRRGHEILLRESQEETSAIKRWDDQLDERNRDPMSSPPPTPPSVFESASLGGQRRRGDDDDDVEGLRGRSSCLLRLSFCHPSLLPGRVPFCLRQSPPPHPPLSPRGESVSKVIPQHKFG